MKYALLMLFLMGAALVWFGLRATNDDNQSADVRIGGIIPIFIGGALMLLSVVLAILAALFGH